MCDNKKFPWYPEDKFEITSHCLGNELVLPPQRHVWNSDHTQDNWVN